MPEKQNGPEMHRLRTPEDDESEGDAEAGSDESAVAEAASVFGERPALRVVTSGTGAGRVRKVGNERRRCAGQRLVPMLYAGSLAY